MGLFSKKECSICGTPSGVLSYRKLADGILCKECRSRLSPFYDATGKDTVAGNLSHRLGEMIIVFVHTLGLVILGLGNYISLTHGDITDISAVMELVSGDRFVTSKFPPAFVMTCPGDFIKDQAKYIIEAFTANSVPFCYRFYGNETNPLHHVFHCNMRLPEAKKCNDDECKFFKEYIK